MIAIIRLLIYSDHKNIYCPLKDTNFTKYPENLNNGNANFYLHQL